MAGRHAGEARGGPRSRDVRTRRPWGGQPTRTLCRKRLCRFCPRELDLPCERSRPDSDLGPGPVSPTPRCVRAPGCFSRAAGSASFHHPLTQQGQPQGWRTGTHKGPGRGSEGV